MEHSQCIRDARTGIYKADCNALKSLPEYHRQRVDQNAGLKREVDSGIHSNSAWYQCCHAVPQPESKQPDCSQS